ncbi:MAG TPA: DUF4115 domain-containing protein [Candidatus Aminicenantes bacterium]|nr:DUF4115 domain-containing protein [Candidatus Aminicenantes bacterium]
MTTLGQYLKNEREARGISLKEISAATKIGMKYLLALETDDWGLFDGTFFAKSILRTYVHTIGIDEKAVLDRFNEALGIRETAEDSKKAPRICDIMTRRHWTILGSVVAAAVLIIVAFILIPGGKEKAPSPAATAPPQAQSRPIGTAMAIKPEPPPVKPEVKELVLQMTFTQLTWIQVFADGELKLDGLMRAGQEADVKASRELVIHVGNAGGLAYKLNGEAGGSFGRAGAVIKNIRITLDNYRQYLAPPGPGAEKIPPGS